MKKVLLGALAVVAMVACSKDDVVEVNRVNDQITYGAVVNSATRAADVYCNNYKPGSFKVSAVYDDKFYFTDETVTYNNSTSAWESGSVHYWPNVGEVIFYAHVNGDTEYTHTNATDAPQFVNFTVADATEDQVDLLYAVQRKEKSADPVKLNFRHALSQVVFKAKNGNTNLYVEISDITLCNLAQTSTFTFTQEATDTNIEDHTGSVVTDITYNNTWGSWPDLNGGDVDFSVILDSPVVIPYSSTGEAVNLTDVVDGPNSKAMMMLPQSTTKWDATSKLNETTQSYALVNCCIYNIADPSIGLQGTDVALWGTKALHQQVAVPMPFIWQQGKKYIYTLVFGMGTGGGGYEPDPDDPTPDPVLVPISYDVTVDDFVVIDGGEYDVNL